jgi:hypothetical protein
LSGKAIRETLGFLGVIASLAFVGAEISQNTVAARAAAYQAIGIATSESWLSISEDPRRSDLFHVEQFDTGAVAEWNDADWAQVYSIWTAWIRNAEVLALQVEQGLLPPDAMDDLGYRPGPHAAFPSPALECLWPRISRRLGPTMRDEYPATAFSIDCEGLGLPRFLGSF